jgi:uncharacterized protein YdeI (YjbR/CyaY-like superfamily)
VPADDYPVLLFKDGKAWAKWLDKNHAAAPGVWLRLGKKNSRVRAVTYGEALEEALCYGWIDGQTNKFDEDTFLQKFTPRRKGSVWSKVNREKIAALEAAGRMKPAGLAEVEKAKANGRWEAAYSSAAPAELTACLARNAKARAFYETLDRTNRVAIHYRIQTLRKPENRARKAAEFTAMLAEGRKLFDSVPRRR